MATPASDNFAQLKLLFTDPIQHDYEAIRPIVLFAETVSARSQAIDLDRTTLGDKARRFLQHGMLGLVDQRATQSGRKAHHFPQPVEGYILYLKQLYPPIHDREIVRILERKFGYHTNHHTVQHFLEHHPIPVQLPLDWTSFHDFADAYRARWTVVRLYYEGWHQRSIAGCLKLSRKHVHQLIRSFEQDGFAGLEDQRTRPANHPENQLSLPFLKEVLDVQRAHPRAGRFRVRGILAKNRGEAAPSEASVGRAMRQNRTHHGAPGPWSSDAQQPGQDRRSRSMPFRPLYRHQYWFIDLRYLRQFDGRWIYSICVLEGYSRKLLAGMVSEYQDELAVLQLLVAALSEYGCPSVLVSDNGAVFTAHAYCRLLETLGIEPRYIKKGKPWQNLIEAQFKIQLRLADATFEQATTVAEVQEQHAAFVELFNTTPHWAHRKREDGLATPAAVLAWMRGRTVQPDELRVALRELQLERTVNRHGYVSIQRFYIYAEQGLARKRVAIWLYEGRLHVTYRQALLARYSASYTRRGKRLQAVSEPKVYESVYRTPQLELWELDDDQWRKVLERAALVRRGKGASRIVVEQVALPLAGLLLALLTWAAHSAKVAEA